MKGERDTENPLSRSPPGHERRRRDEQRHEENPAAEHPMKRAPHAERRASAKVGAGAPRSASHAAFPR